MIKLWKIRISVHNLDLSQEDSVENGDISQAYILFMILYSKFNNPNMLSFEL